MMRVWDIDLLGPADLSVEEVESLVRECLVVEVSPAGTNLRDLLVPEELGPCPARPGVAWVSDDCAAGPPAGTVP